MPGSTSWLRFVPTISKMREMFPAKCPDGALCAAVSQNACLFCHCAATSKCRAGLFCRTLATCRDCHCGKPMHLVYTAAQSTGLVFAMCIPHPQSLRSRTPSPRRTPQHDTPATVSLDTKTHISAPPMLPPTPLRLPTVQSGFLGTCPECKQLAKKCVNRIHCAKSYDGACAWCHCDQSSTSEEIIMHIDGCNKQACTSYACNGWDESPPCEYCHCNDV